LSKNISIRFAKCHLKCDWSMCHYYQWHASLGFTWLPNIWWYYANFFFYYLWTSLVSFFKSPIFPKPHFWANRSKWESSVHLSQILR
jgi:hypothetical protein